MAEHPPPRILILEMDEEICLHARAILTREGWEVVWEKDSKKALNHLELSKDSPFHLFISSYKSPHMEDYDIFKQAKSISPMTRRMFMVRADKPDMAIKAIYKGGINSCLILPFRDEELVSQTRNCLNQFQVSMKRWQLKRITAHQNQQMFQIAQKLKKKADTSQLLIEEKKAKLRVLHANLKAALKHREDPEKITLADRLQQNRTPATPEAFQTEFYTLYTYAKSLFDAVASRIGLDPPALDFHSLASCQRTTEGTLPGALLVPHLLKAALLAPSNPVPHISPKKVLTLEDGSWEKVPVEITISEEQTEATIQRTNETDFPGQLTLSTLLDMLGAQNITHGIIDDESIEAWISGEGKDTLVVARGEAPVYGQEGIIEFYFKKECTSPGKIMEDGTIDFRDRGDIPYANKGDLLARKRPAQAGKNGINVFGRAIVVDAPRDPVFSAGSGTHFSQDSLTILAALDGQPHVDALGNITVNPELMIKGDVNFETGNIDFNGNIIVQGTIKQGFRVKGINLTAQEIEGGLIDLSGNLFISDGITNATITAQGNVIAKFINHSSLLGFGDLVIQKEIIDSDIFLSGACQNPTGHILTSRISAKKGIEAGKIGTVSSRPSLLRVGVEDHIEILTGQIDTRVKESKAQLQELRKKIKSIELQDQKLYERITRKAQIQEKALNEIRKIRQTLPELENNPDKTHARKAADRINALSQAADLAEKKLSAIFETQDGYARQIHQLKEQMTRIEETNKSLVLQKNGLGRFADTTPGLARVMVHKKIIQDTAIQGPNASTTVREDLARCQIQETAVMEEGIHLYLMAISPL